MPRVLVLSDPHICSRPGARVRGVDSRAGLRVAVADSEQHGPYDRVILTGDLAEDPVPESYAALREIVGCWGADVLLLPGNHDLPGIMAGSLGTPGGGHGFDEGLGGWRLIGLDTHWPGKIAGRLGPAQLARLDALLAAPDDERPVALFLHHPPVKVQTIWLDPSRLSDGPELGRVLDRRPGRVKLILHGHAHMPAEGVLAGVPVLGVPSTAFQFVQGSLLPARGPVVAGYRVLELGAGTFTSTVRYARPR